MKSGSSLAKSFFFLCVSLKMFTSEEKATTSLVPDFESSLQADRLPISMLTTQVTDEMANRLHVYTDAYRPYI